MPKGFRISLNRTSGVLVAVAQICGTAVKESRSTIAECHLQRCFHQGKGSFDRPDGYRVRDTAGSACQDKNHTAGSGKSDRSVPADDLADSERIGRFERVETYVPE